MLRNWGLKELGTSYEQGIGFTDNQWQYIPAKVIKPCKIGQNQKKMISASAKVLTTIVNNYFFERKLKICLCLHPILIVSFFFLICEATLIWNLFY